MFCLCSFEQKCDARLPQCSRCANNNVPCYSQTIIPRRSRIVRLEDTVLRLESDIALLSESHHRNLILQSLLAKLRILSSPTGTQLERRPFSRQLALWPYATIPIAAASASACGKIVDEELEVGYAPAVPREMMSQMVHTCAPIFDGGALPASFSLWMCVLYNVTTAAINEILINAHHFSRIRLFLPYHIHFHFVTDIRLFFVALARPPEDPRSVHPALLNAIYLATCWIVGGELDSLKKYFLAQTRYHLGKALETGDRLMHFLWANLILGSFFAIEGRMNDAYVTVSSCVQFAVACGLDVGHYRHTASLAHDPLLPPPIDDAESIDRSQLSYALYILDRTVAMVTGTPSAFAGDKGPLTRPSLEVEGVGSSSMTTEVR